MRWSEMEDCRGVLVWLMKNVGVILAVVVDVTVVLMKCGLSWSVLLVEANGRYFRTPRG